MAIAAAGASTTYRANGASDATAAASYGLADIARCFIIPVLDPRSLIRTALALDPVSHHWREIGRVRHLRV